MIFLPVTPLEIISGVNHRIRYGKWPRNGRITIYRDGVYLSGARGDILDLCLLDEPRTSRYIYTHFRNDPHGIFLDLGAHVGAYSIPIAKHGVKVIAFEPSPSSFRFLEYNKLVNRIDGNCTLHNVAVWYEDGYVFLNISPLRSGGDSIMQDSADKVKVRAMDLSYFLDEDVSLVKMDIERAEEPILKNIGSSITSVKKWVIEVSEATAGNVARLMKGYGYHYRVIERLIGGKSQYNVLFER